MTRMYGWDSSFYFCVVAGCALLFASVRATFLLLVVIVANPPASTITKITTLYEVNHNKKLEKEQTGFVKTKREKTMIGLPRPPPPLPT